jgi:hypothetical protein
VGGGVWKGLRSACAVGWVLVGFLVGGFGSGGGGGGWVFLHFKLDNLWWLVGGRVCLFGGGWGCAAAAAVMCEVWAVHMLLLLLGCVWTTYLRRKAKGGGLHAGWGSWSYEALAIVARGEFG